MGVLHIKPDVDFSRKDLAACVMINAEDMRLFSFHEIDEFSNKLKKALSIAGDLANSCNAKGISGSYKEDI